MSYATARDVKTKVPGRVDAAVDTRLGRVYLPRRTPEVRSARAALLKSDDPL